MATNLLSACTALMLIAIHMTVYSQYGSQSYFLRCKSKHITSMLKALDDSPSHSESQLQLTLRPAWQYSFSPLPPPWWPLLHFLPDYTDKGTPCLYVFSLNTKMYPTQCLCWHWICCSLYPDSSSHRYLRGSCTQFHCRNNMPDQKVLGETHLKYSFKMYMHLLAFQNTILNSETEFALKGYRWVRYPYIRTVYSTPYIFSFMGNLKVLIPQRWVLLKTFFLLLKDWQYTQFS